MNRKSLLFACALFLLVAVKFALGQVDDYVDGSIIDAGYDDPSEWIFSVMMCAPILGAVIGAVRVLAQRIARPAVEPICLR